MSKVKNEDKIRDASTIVASLLKVVDLNKCSITILKNRTIPAIEENDGNVALATAKHAEYMNIFFREVFK